MRRLSIMIFAVMLPLAFFMPLSRGNTAPAPSGQPFTVDRIEEGIAALCSEDGRCYFIPEAVLGQILDPGAYILLGVSQVQSPESERRARLELKAGDLQDDM